MDLNSRMALKTPRFLGLQSNAQGNGGATVKQRRESTPEKRHVEQVPGELGVLEISEKSDSLDHSWADTNSTAARRIEGRTLQFFDECMGRARAELNLDGNTFMNPSRTLDSW
jgi:hypothetical protein